MRAARQRGLPGGHQPFELTAAPDERPGAGQHRGEARPLEGLITRLCRRHVARRFQPQLENVLRAGQVAELPHP